MASIKVPYAGDTKVKVLSSNKTVVAKVVVGKPIRSVVATSGVDIGNISGIDVSGGKEDGDVLVYRSSSNNFEPTRILDKQFINGGQY